MENGENAGSDTRAKLEKRRAQSYRIIHAAGVLHIRWREVQTHVDRRACTIICSSSRHSSLVPFDIGRETGQSRELHPVAVREAAGSGLPPAM